jgi:hypothetical protein
LLLQLNVTERASVCKGLDANSALVTKLGAATVANKYKFIPNV